MADTVPAEEYVSLTPPNAEYALWQYLPFAGRERSSATKSLHKDASVEIRTIRVIIMHPR